MEKLTRRSFLGVAGAAALTLAACDGGTPADGGDQPDDGAEGDGAEAAAKVIMVTDTGGVNDQSFNELSWAGMQQLGTDLGWDVSYLESKQDADYMTNLDKAVDAGAQLIWGVGFAMGAAVNEAALANPDVQFAIIDSTNDNGAPNLTGVTFKQEECSFAVGYVAARMTTSGKVGFVGGIDSEIMQSFEQGYYAGIEYANKEQGLSVTYQGQWAESFGDAAKGKAIAQSQIADGCDVLYHAAGGTGTGMIEACAEAGVWAIGVDQDQSHLAPETVITSALKRVDQAIYQISPQLIDGSLAGGSNIVLGAAEDAVGIAPTHDLLPDEVYQGALAVIDKIKAGEITVPKNADELATYKAGL
ncbi:BMP family ABC transporter substrate-binding protein [Coriobacteriales bacterium OH1046]|nr:BMP family ABC transporter substrate-binding protein [Coriobacteriales bacterium OH1046]